MGKGLGKVCYGVRIQLQAGLMLETGEGNSLTGLSAAVSLRYWPRTRCRSGREGHRACFRLLGEKEEETGSQE